MENKQLLAVAYGLGVDSTAALVLLQQQGRRPDYILFADTGSEKQETYDYLPVIQAWLEKVGFPPVTVVRKVVKNFKHWPPYHTLGENCLTNGTLPSLAFGFKSCSLKWKVYPQNMWMKQQELAQQAWARGERIRKVIGYDNSPKDRKRFAHAVGMEDPQYEYWYPLIDAGMDREACKEMIRSAGLPVPPKSACIFCPATQPAELHEHRKEYLRYIVIMEARAKPRLEGCMTQEQLDADFKVRYAEWEENLAALMVKHGERSLAAAVKASGHLQIIGVEVEVPKEHPDIEAFRKREPKLRLEGKGSAGLWRSATKNRPAMMTDYILKEGLLPEEEVRFLQERAPKEIIDNQEAFANGEEIPNWIDFLEQFTPEDAMDEVSGGCAGCIHI